MVSQKLFDAVPPFPSNIPTAEVPKISLSKLSSGDPAFAYDLFRTCCTTGFFLLDMRGDETGNDMIRQIETMFNISNSTFDLDIEEKSRYSMDPSKDNYNGCVTSNPCNLDLFSSAWIVKLRNETNKSYLDGNGVA